MKVTPLDLRQQQFKTVMRGYDRGEVASFLQEAADDYETALRENDKLRQELEKLQAVLGEHRGLLGYTIGQREGLGVAAGRPLYVVAMDREANRLVVGGREELLRSDLEAERFNWVSMEPPTASVRAAAKIRSRHVPAPCRATPGAGGRVRLTFDEPQAAITPGQAVVLYQDDVLLGGGWISAERGTPQTVDAGREARGA